MKENNFPNNKIRLAVSYGIRESVWKESKAKNMTLNHLMTLIWFNALITRLLWKPYTQYELTI